LCADDAATATVLFVVFSSASAWAKTGSQGIQPFVLKLPHDIDSTKMFFEYYATVAFGGYGIAS
jgi:hypothetical protein